MPAPVTMTPQQRREYIRLSLGTPEGLAALDAADQAPPMSRQRLERVVSIFQTHRWEANK